MLRRHLATLLLASALAAPAAAQDDARYSEWRPDGAEAAGASALEALAQELEALIDEADRARAADPRFLQDLRDKIADHVADARPRPPLIRDDFSDGDYTDDPGWTVVSGDFSVESERGLRTVVALAGAEPSLTDDPLDAILDTGDKLLDKGGDLLESGASALDDLLGGDKKKQAKKEEEAVDVDAGPVEPEPAEISLGAAIPNAFALELEMTSALAHEDAQFEIDLFQGRGGTAGYRLTYLAGGKPALLLARFGRRGAVVIGEHDDALPLEDGRSHTLVLARASDGTMTASVDGSALIRVQSNAFDDPFDGVSLVNSGGDYAIRSIAVHDNS